jgi:hypothetical protein
MVLPLILSKKRRTEIINLSTTIVVNGVEEDIDIPINLNFFWPDL